MNIYRRNTALPLILVCGFALAACSSNESDSPAPATAPASGGAAAGAATDAGSPLSKAQVSTTLEQVGKTVYNPADDSLHLTVKVSNNGTAAFPAGGSKPVQLAAVQLVPDPSNPDGKRAQDVRASFKGDLQPGSSQDVSLIIPNAFAAGNKVQLELLQEQVAWFGYDYKQPVLVLGPFEHCKDGKALCNADGSPVPTE